MFGSIEASSSILIEHYAGAFPTWLAPIQARVLPITDRQTAYARKIMLQLQSWVRAEVDERNEKIGTKFAMLSYRRFPTC